LFGDSESLTVFEDVGRHNAIAGRMWMQGDYSGPEHGADKTFYATGRLTSEMVMKAAQMSVPIIVSRSGVRQMGHELAHGSA
jgi:FdhD protein